MICCDNITETQINLIRSVERMIMEQIKQSWTGIIQVVVPYLGSQRRYLSNLNLAALNDENINHHLLMNITVCTGTHLCGSNHLHIHFGENHQEFSVFAKIVTWYSSIVVEKKNKLRFYGDVITASIENYQRPLLILNFQ